MAGAEIFSKHGGACRLRDRYTMRILDTKAARSDDFYGEFKF
jgi:hypothetical protein